MAGTERRVLGTARCHARAPVACTMTAEAAWRGFVAWRLVLTCANANRRQGAAVQEGEPMVPEGD